MHEGSVQDSVELSLDPGSWGWEQCSSVLPLHLPGAGLRHRLPNPPHHKPLLLQLLHPSLLHSCTFRPGDSSPVVLGQVFEEEAAAAAAVPGDD